LVNSRSIASPPNWPGGSEMPCTTTSVTSRASGRASALGERTRRARAASLRAISCVRRSSQAASPPDRRCDNPPMELVIGIPVLVALVAGFIAVRRTILRRRRSLQAYTRTRDERLRRSRPRSRRTSRAEMRANEDPTTVMGEIRTKARRNGNGSAA
jgi:hypothetical protein